MWCYKLFIYGWNIPPLYLVLYSLGFSFISSTSTKSSFKEIIFFCYNDKSCSDVTLRNDITCHVRVEIDEIDDKWSLSTANLHAINAIIASNPQRACARGL